MQLLSKETYERRYPEQGVNPELCPVFYLKKISVAEKTSMDDSSFELTPNGMRFLSGTWDRLKLKYCLVDWKNIVDNNNNIVPCTEENKERLSELVYIWLINEINELNGIGKVITEEERKNL